MSAAATCTVLHLSDPHFGTEIPEVVLALERLSERLRPDLLVLSGDITQRARSAQFDAAQAFVERLHIPRQLVIPGNHDIPLFNLPARLLAPYAGWQRVFGKNLEPVISIEQLLAIGVRTTRRWRHKHGQVSDRQIARVSHLLRTARPEQLKLVVTHQPLDVVTETDRNNLLRGHAAARTAWLAAGADLLLAGHIHLPHLRALGAAPHAPPIAVQAGTAVSARLRGNSPNSVNVIRHQSVDGVMQGAIERFAYQETSKSFESAQKLEFHRRLEAAIRSATAPP